MDIKEGSHITDAPAILATLYPALFEIVHAELRTCGESEQYADDIVHAAATRWFEVATTEAGAKSYLRKFIHRRVRDIRREAQTHPTVSFDALTREE
jgi:DNA-directed RNA polymerase specialized sigma24 family protein